MAEETKFDLSILIPARNEMFVSKTVERLLEQIRGNTEIIVGLDEVWANPAIKDDPRVTVVYFPEALGQRANTNQLARLSKAKYVMKLDAHCEMGEGFDVILMQDIQDDWTIIPTMRNLHAFDWVCTGSNIKTGQVYTEVVGKGCGWSKYQGPTPEGDKCPNCGGTVERLLVWIAKESPKSRSFLFDNTMHFRYFNEYSKRPEVKAMGEITPSLSAQGSCFMLTRERYWKYDFCDEGHGSWGQQGVEVALKSWESGGKLMIDNHTYYAHMFRTQGGDFSFPYPLSGRQVEKARDYSRDIWINNKWKFAVRTLDDVLNQFYPVPFWHTEEVKKTGDESETEAVDDRKGIIFYTDNKLNLRIAKAVQDNIKKMRIPIISASLKPMDKMGQNIHIDMERGVEAYLTQIIAALEASDKEIVYFCEHDVLYHPSHFEFIPERKDIFYYNQNFWRVRQDSFAVHWDANQVSGLVCYRELALKWYKEKLEETKKEGFNRSYEPGGRDTNAFVTFKSKFPNIDIRHEGNLTKSKWSPNDFRDKSTCVNWEEGTILTSIQGWDYDTIFKALPPIL